MCVCAKRRIFTTKYNLYFLETERNRANAACCFYSFSLYIWIIEGTVCFFILIIIFVIEKKVKFQFFFIFRVFLKVVKHETKKYIKSFQPVHYNARDIEAQHLHVRNEFHHRRKRRSLADGPKVEIEFNVADRKFELILRGNADVFDDDYEVEDSQGHSLQHRIDHLGPGVTQF